MIDRRPPGDGDLCRHGGTDPARRLPAGLQRRGRRGHRACTSRSRPFSAKVRKKRPALAEGYRRLERNPRRHGNRKLTLLRHSRLGWSGVARRGGIGRVRGAIRGFGGVRVDEVTRDAHSPEEISGRREAAQGRADRRHDRRVRPHGRPTSSARSRPSRTAPASTIRRISPIRPMPRPRSTRRENLKRSADELKAQLDDAQAALGEAFEELKKVELLDERDQARERAEANAREQAELDRIGAIRFSTARGGMRPDRIRGREIDGAVNGAAFVCRWSRSRCRRTPRSIPPTRLSVIGSPTSCVASSAGGDRIDRHGVGDARRRRALQRHHPEDEGQRAAADAEIDAGDPLRRAEARAAPRRGRSAARPRSSAAAPAPMPTARKPSALDRWMKGRDQTL